MTNRRPATDEIEPGIPATNEMPPNVPEGWEDEEEPAPLDVPQGVNQWGTTAREEALGESVDQRRKREEPDFPRRARPEPVRLMDDGDAAVEDLDYSLSAEEAAMQVVDEPPGANYDPDPGYLSDDDTGRE